MTDYRSWLRKQVKRGDKIGDLARDAFSDVEWDGKQKTLKKITKDTLAEEAFEMSIEEFRSLGKVKRKSARGPYPLEFGTYSRVFRIKKDIEEHYRKIKSDAHSGNACIDQEEMHALLQHHPSHHLSGWEEITVGVHHVDNSICFKADGVPISYRECIHALGKPVDLVDYQIRKFKSAARFEVQYLIDEMDRLRPDHHIDHITYFGHILHDWCEDNNVNIGEMTFSGSGRCTTFTDKELSDSWRNYHEKRAKLRSISAEDNQKRQPAKLYWRGFF